MPPPAPAAITRRYPLKRQFGILSKSLVCPACLWNALPQALDTRPDPLSAQIATTTAQRRTQTGRTHHQLTPPTSRTMIVLKQAPEAFRFRVELIQNDELSTLNRRPLTTAPPCPSEHLSLQPCQAHHQSLGQRASAAPTRSHHSKAQCL